MTSMHIAIEHFYNVYENVTLIDIHIVQTFDILRINVFVTSSKGERSISLFSSELQ